MSGNENCRNVITSPHQFKPQFGPRHPRHGNIQNETLCPLDESGLKEIARRSEYFGGESELPEKIGQRLSHGVIVIDYTYQDWGGVHVNHTDLHMEAGL